MRRIFLDTNFILNTVTWKIDLFGELQRICDFNYDVVVLSNVREELNKYKALGGKKKETANVAMLVLDKNGAKAMKATGFVDDSLVKIATKDDVVATQDQDLKRRLKAKNVSTISIREKGYLDIINRVL